MREAPLLSRDQLDHLERCWRARGVPLAARLNAGLPPERMQEMVAPLGLALPVEAQMWWGWHDGVSLDRTARAVLREICPLQQFLPLAEAVNACLEVRKMAEEIEPEAPDEFWWPSWLPLTQLGHISLDTSGPPDQPSPVHDTDWHHTWDGYTPVAGSLGQVVDWWIQALDDGVWHYDERKGVWRTDEAPLRDPARRAYWARLSKRERSFLGLSPG